MDMPDHVVDRKRVSRRAFVAGAASVGVAASMLGYWMSRGWHERAHATPADGAATPTAVAGAARRPG